MTNDSFITPEDIAELERVSGESFRNLPDDEQKRRLELARQFIGEHFQFNDSEAKRLVNLFETMGGQKAFFLECYGAALDKQGLQPGEWVDDMVFSDEVRERIARMKPYFGYRTWRDHLKDHFRPQENVFRRKTWDGWVKLIVEIQFALNATGFLQRGYQQAGTRFVVRINPDMIERKSYGSD